MVDSFHVRGAALMSSLTQDSGRVSFGEFELNLETAELRHNGSKSILPGKPFQILITLLARPGQLVTREELKRQLWPSDTFVDFDLSLNKAVNRLRESLGDSAEHPRFVETLPRRGYRFIHAVQTAALQTGADEAAPIDQLAVESTTGHASDQKLISDPGDGPVARPYGSRYIPAAIITVVALAIGGLAIYRWRGHPKGADLATVQITKLTDSGRAQDVAISPDGRYVLYAQSDGEEESLHLRQIAARGDVQILPAGPGFHGLTFSPEQQLYLLRPIRSERSLFQIFVLNASARRPRSENDR
jgi:DNA-binding winged helix-turn-helix (wHTH) protein